MSDTRIGAGFASALRALAVALVVAVALTGCRSNADSPVVRIASLDWKASVPVMEEGQVRQEGWDLPEGATLVSAQLRPHQTIQFESEGIVGDTERTFYATWFVYEVSAPITVDTVEATGRKSEPVKAPEPELAEGQSVGETSMQYTLTSEAGDTWPVDEAVWQKLEVGSTCRLTVTDGWIVTDAEFVDASELASEARDGSAG